MLKKGDIILAVVLLVVVAVGYGALRIYNTGSAGRVAVIRQNNRVIRRIDLDRVEKPEVIAATDRYSNEILVENEIGRAHV